MKSQINLNDLLTDFSELESVKEELKSTISENISARNNKIIVVFDNEKFSWTYGYLLINLFYLEFCSMYKRKEAFSKGKASFLSYIASIPPNLEYSFANLICPF